MRITKKCVFRGNEAPQCDLHEATSFGGVAALPRWRGATLYGSLNKQPFPEHSSQFSGRFVSCFLLHQVVSGETWKERRKQATLGLNNNGTHTRAHTHSSKKTRLNTVIHLLLISLSKWVNYSVMDTAATLQRHGEAGRPCPPYLDILSDGYVLPEESRILINQRVRLDCDWLSGTAAVSLKLIQVGYNDQQKNGQQIIVSVHNIQNISP